MIRRLLLAAAFVTVAFGIALPTASAGGFCADPSTFSAADTTQIDIKNFCFTPTVAYVQVGDTVTFTNRDKEVHNLGGVNDVFGNLHDELMPGDDMSYTFDTEGTFPYLCILHPGMAGAIVIGDGRDDDTGTPGGAIAPAQPPTSSGAASGAGTSAWVIVAGIALGLGALGLAAIPRRRATSLG
ncbi:MAG: hypothetical protein QOG54_2143 [Actinomycetota bacterium]|jgi:plastocyanin|nr:hypothetical protein [Actinomycetota bacterium]